MQAEEEEIIKGIEKEPEYRKKMGESVTEDKGEGPGLGKKSSSCEQCCQYMKQSKDLEGAPSMAQWVTNPTSILEDVGSIPGLSQWVKDPGLP